MRRADPATAATRLARPALLLLAALAATGCHGEEKTDYESVSEPPTVRLVSPQARTIVRRVGQPSFVVSYERTAVYPKLTAYIDKWVVDIGDRVKKGDLLATLFVPEIVEDHRTKQATVGLDRERIALAKEVVRVAAADVGAAQARVGETRAQLAAYQAEVLRWESTNKRLTRESEKSVISPQIALEATNQLGESIATRDAAKATVAKAEADLLARKAALAQAEVDVKVAEAALAVAQSDERRLSAWVGYLTLSAPYDGIIVARNANTFDFVLPATGDPSALQRAPDTSPGGAAPIYVVDRTDVVRVFVDIPEHEAEYVKIGTKASVRARAYRDRPIPGTVTRTSWALDVKSRTMRAEIDLPNPGSRLLPGMYAYGTVIIERTGVKSLPVEALARAGDRTYFWSYQDGKAARNEVRTGLDDGRWIEVAEHRAPGAGGGSWVPFDGQERVILGDLSILDEGEPVRVDTGDNATRVASESPPKGPSGAAASPARP